MGRKVARVIKRAADVAMAAVLAVSAVVFVFITVPELAGAKALAVVSGSMEPDIPVGSLVVVYPSSCSSLESGDDISYYLGDSDIIVTHRVQSVDYGSGVVVTKGLANSSCDPEVPLSDVIGKVNFCIPYAGFVLTAMSGTAAKAAASSGLLALIALAVLADEMCREEDRKQKTMRDKNAPEMTAAGNLP